MSNPLVSIIIPTYNRAHLIGETIESIIAQTYGNWECIIVDDGSIDHTEKTINYYCNKDNRIKYYKRTKKYKAGGNGARNYGFELSGGEYIIWFDSDDIMLPNKIKDDIQEAVNYDLDFVISSGFSSNFELQNLKEKPLNIKDELYVSYTTWQSNIFLPSILFLKKFINQFRLFDEKLVRGQENDFFSRVFFLTRDSAKFKILKKYNYIYRQHKGNKQTKQKQEYISGYIKSFAYLSLVNLERGNKINNEKVLNFHFENLKKYFYLSLNEKDSKVASFIYLNLLLKLFQINLKIASIFFVAGIFSFLKGGTSYYFKGILNSYTLK